MNKQHSAGEAIMKESEKIDIVQFLISVMCLEKEHCQFLLRHIDSRLQKNGKSLYSPRSGAVSLSPYR